MNFVPLAIKQSERRGRCNFSAYRLPEVRIGEHGSQSVTLQAKCWFPALQTLDGVGRSQREVHGERATRHLTDQALAAGIGVRNLFQVFKHRIRVGAVVQQRGNHHGSAGLLGHVL